MEFDLKKIKELWVFDTMELLQNYLNCSVQLHYHQPGHEQHPL